VLEVRFGDAALVRIAGLAVLAGLGLPIEARRRQPGPGAPTADRLGLERVSCLVGGAVVLASFALVGHPQATSAPLLPIVQCVHVLVVSTWFGGVAFLAIELRRERQQRQRQPQQHRSDPRVSAEIVARFSTLATGLVPIAVATGAILANAELSDLRALVDTGYGRALLVKLSALAVPLAIGGYNRQRLVPAIVRRDEPAAWRHLRRTLVLEVLFIALGVLLATAAMTSGGF
jgi:putative copper export protein